MSNNTTAETTFSIERVEGVSQDWVNASAFTHFEDLGIFLDVTAFPKTDGTTNLDMNASAVAGNHVMRNNLLNLSLNLQQLTMLRDVATLALEMHAEATTELDTETENN